MRKRIEWEFVDNQISLLPCIGIVKHRYGFYKYSVCFFFLKFRCRYRFGNPYKIYKPKRSDNNAE